MKEIKFTIEDLMKKDKWQLAILYQFVFDEVIPVYEAINVGDWKLAIIQSVLSGVKIKVDSGEGKIF